MLMTVPAGAFIDSTTRKRLVVVGTGFCTVLASFLILWSQAWIVVTTSQIATAIAGASIGPAVAGMTLGIVRQRQAAIQGLARAVADGSLDLDGQADLSSTLQSLQALPGIGPWTAHYIALRALRWPDAWPTGDVALHQALGLNHRLGAATRRQADSLASAWRPWRSYAVLRTWAGTYQGPATAPQEPTP
jgi:AraC family transcriptional regulator of adaptative response / DNA-3-methyladenine glycosylase II